MSWFMWVVAIVTGVIGYHLARRRRWTSALLVLGLIVINLFAFTSQRVSLWLPALLAIVAIGIGARRPISNRPE